MTVRGRTTSSGDDPRRDGEPGDAAGGRHRFAGTDADAAGDDVAAQTEDVALDEVELGGEEVPIDDDALLDETLPLDADRPATEPSRQIRQWRRYVADFHAERAGVVEAVLSRALAGDHSPYRWLARAVSPDAKLVLDLACGSGPMSRELAQPGRTVIGLDLAAAELALAAERGPGPWVRGDALALPFRDGTFDAVTSSMGLVVATPLTQVVDEIQRVLRPGGVLAGIAPAIRPLRPKDIRVLSRLSTRLRTKPQFPGPVELAGFTKTLALHGLRRVEDQRERYRFTVRSRADAELMLRALYLPGTRPSRIEAALEFLEDRVTRRGSVDLAIPMRRVVAIK